MTKVCPLPTPAERQLGEIQIRIENAMMRKVYAALQEAAEQARSEVRAADIDLPPPSMDYFTAVIHQSMYCTLCKADPSTLSGDRTDIAMSIIRNSQNIARHHWGANIEPQLKA